MSDEAALLAPLGGEPNALLVGGKAAGLMRLVRARFAVPPAFVVTTRGFRRAASEPALAARIAAQCADPTASGERALAEAFVVPAELEAQLGEACAALGSDAALAVRSSATAEDSAEASFAGQQESCLAVPAGAALLRAVRQCWASLYSARAVDYRRRRGTADGTVAMALVVQRMVDARVAGTMSTVDPVSHDPRRLLVTASFGVGDLITAGLVTPDSWLLGRDGAVVRAAIADKAQARRRDGAGLGLREVARAQRRAPSLTAGELAALAALGQRLEAQLGAPQEVEWAMDEGALWVLQSRPMTGQSPTQLR